MKKEIDYLNGKYEVCINGASTYTHLGWSAWKYMHSTDSATISGNKDEAVVTQITTNGNRQIHKIRRKGFVKNPIPKEWEKDVDKNNK